MSRSENGSLSSPTTTTTTTTTPTDNNSTISHQRLCHIVKRDNFDGYGFNLHSEKGKPGQYIGKVDENSPAEEAGLRQGDRIIEVNGVNIGSETHKQVVQRIKAIANEVRLLVIDPSQEIKNVVNNSKTANDTVITTTTSPIITTTSTITVQSSTVQAETTTTNQTKSNKEILDTSFKEIDSNNRIISSGSASPTTSVKNDMNSAASCSSVVNNNNNTNNNNNINKSTDKRDSFNNNNNNKNSDVDDKNIPLSPPSPSPPSPSPPPTTATSAASSLQSHQNGTTTSMALTGGTANSNQQKPTGLNLPMTAAEMRAKLLSKKKYDPKNDSVDLRKKFEIIQKL